MSEQQVARRADDADEVAENRLAARLDAWLFVAGGVLSVYLSYLTLLEGIQPGWPALLVLAFWGLVAYLVLPRIHRLLTRIYVPDYFIGRSRTADGLLGDPVNLALLGSADQVHTAMRNAGWTRADEVTLGTGWRIVVSSLLGRTYETAPVSPLFLFQRRQDFAYQQEVAGSPNKRHHVRFWRCPDEWLLPGGTRVDWLAAGTFDRRVGLSLFTLQVTHKIGSDIDEERDHIVDTVSAADAAVRVRVIENFATGYHARNGGGDRIETDGDLPVIDLTGVSASGSGVAAVVTRDTPAPPAPLAPVRREHAIAPAQVLFAAVVTVLRGLGNLILAITALLGLYGPLGIDPADAPGVVLTVVGVTLGAAAATDLTLIGLLLARQNWARLVLCTLSLISASAVYLNRVLAHESGRLGGDLVNLALSVLVLLALSSEAARAYTHPHRDRLP